MACKDTGLKAACAAAFVLVTATAYAHDVGELHVPSGASPALQSFLTHVRKEAIMQDTEVVTCTLSGGTKTKCVKFILKQEPSYEPGPWCPNNISDGPEAGGFWIDKGKVYDVDGSFVKNLAEFYNDPKWKMYDPKTGDVLVSRSFDACFGIARLDVWKQYYFHCAQCTPDQTLLSPLNTFFIPLNPVKAEKPTPLTNHPGAGVALNGVRFEGPAPLDAILRAYSIAPFDDCGGHVNPFGGYHYHFVTGCIENVGQADGHAPQVGISIDGYGIYKRLDMNGNEPADLDQCRGHQTKTLGYHYHAAALGENSIIGCHRGELGCVASPGTQVCDATKQSRPPPPVGNTRQ
jgi:YHYH protein